MFSSLTAHWGYIMADRRVRQPSSDLSWHMASTICSQNEVCRTLHGSNMAVQQPPVHIARVELCSCAAHKIHITLHLNLPLLPTCTPN